MGLKAGQQQIAQVIAQLCRKLIKSPIRCVGADSQKHLLLIAGAPMRRRAGTAMAGRLFLCLGTRCGQTERFL